MKIINNKDYPKWWKDACKELSNKDKIMQNLISSYPDSCLSTIKNPFYSLSRCIVGQQISVQAADAIWQRLIKSFNIYDENCFKRINPRYLKSFGLSERKVDYLIGLSNYMSDNNLFKYWDDLKSKKNHHLYSQLSIGLSFQDI